MACRLKQIGWACLVTITIAASLLTFPNAVVWMVAVWLLSHSVLVLSERPGWIPLALCAGILLVKRVYPCPGLVLLAAMILAVLGWHGLRVIRKCQPGPKPVIWGSVVALWVAWLVLALDWHMSAHCSRVPAILPSRPVMCLGDSLTAYGYPTDLGKLLSIPVVNLGQDGITTSDAVKQLPALLDVDPQVVVIELGGHDFLKGNSRAQTKANLAKIIHAFRATGAEVVLMEIPRGFITDSFLAVERELARQYDLELIPDTPIRNLVLRSPYAPPGMWLDRQWHLSNDGLHPNVAGNKFLAEAVAKALTKFYGPAIRAQTKNAGKKEAP